MGFRLGRKSRAELRGVDRRLVQCVERAIEITLQDFTVFDGMRTAAEQAELHRRGASQRDGYKRLSEHQKGRAVDLVPWINGRPRWEWGAIYPIAHAMNVAARDMGLALVWGGAWHKMFTGIHMTSGRSAKELMDDYGRTRRAQKRRPFFDGPHYELHRSVK